jgi:hypothetical protein
MTATENKEGKAMAISFPVPEGARKPKDERVGARAQGHSPIARFGHLLRRLCERVDSAIFDAPGDCMWL